MVPSVRKAFNDSFSEEKYQAFLDELNSKYPGSIDYRIAETPIFCSKDFTQKMMDACESIIDVIVSPDFKAITDRALPKEVNVPNENDHSHFIAFDFGICENDKGELEPQLIEMQGFPTLFAFQDFQALAGRRIFNIPDNYSHYLNGYNEESYAALLKEIIVGNHNPDNVVLLEIMPHQQKTRNDFYYTKEYTGISIVCLTELIQKGRKLYYLHDGVETEIKRIYNRVIFDELQQQTPEVQAKGKLLLEDLEVEWVPHPNWFFRISKFTLPFISSPYVPETRFLNDIKEMPADLENFVLKPLFSFAGQGVVIDVTPADIDGVKDPENWILQRKVKYAEAIQTPDGTAKGEIRLFYFWKDGQPRPFGVNNLGRLSKGKMIGVRYNKDKTWVGGTMCYFEQ